MPKYSDDDDQINDGINLLISILVRYPEIGTISFDPEASTIKMSFMISAVPNDKYFIEIKQVLTDSIIAYGKLEGIAISIADVEITRYDNIAILSVFRDVYTLSKNEITLLISFMKEQFKDYLVIDYNDSVPEEDWLFQEELIDNMLEILKYKQTKHRLIGIREDGRVLVFNK